jgi:hypothetical protein
MANIYPRAQTRAKFKYPRIQLPDFVRDGELGRPTMLEANGDECLTVVKNSSSTGFTSVARLTSSICAITTVWH